MLLITMYYAVIIIRSIYEIHGKNELVVISYTSTVRTLVIHSHDPLVPIWRLPSADWFSLAFTLIILLFQYGVFLLLIGLVLHVLP